LPGSGNRARSAPVTLEELIAGGLHVLCLLGKDATLLPAERAAGLR
jgi:hypothetical protein